MGRGDLEPQEIVRYEEDGPRVVLLRVWIDETRPMLQGSRLTAWELEAAGVPQSVIADSAAASLHGIHRAPYAQSLAALV